MKKHNEWDNKVSENKADTSCTKAQIKRYAIVGIAGRTAWLKINLTI